MSSMAAKPEEIGWSSFPDIQLESISYLSEAQLLNFCKCVICDKELKEPVRMPCLHRFCRGCLAELIEVQKQRIFSCPVCYFDIPLTGNGVDDFPKDLLVSGLLEVISFKRLCLRKDCAHPANCNVCYITEPITCYCFTCKYFLCRECFVEHFKTEAFSNHTTSFRLDESDGKDDNHKLSLIEIAQYLQTEPHKCLTHCDTVLDLCCVNCHNSLVCSKCASDGHESHEVLDLFTAVDKTEAKLKEDIFLLNKNKEKLLEDVTRKTEQLNNKIPEAKHRLKDLQRKSIDAINSEKENDASLKDAIENIVELQQKLMSRLKSLKEKRDGKDEEVNMENHPKLVTETKKASRAKVKEFTEIRDERLEFYVQKRIYTDEMFLNLFDSVSTDTEKAETVMHKVTEKSRNILKRCDNINLTSLFLGATKDPWTFIQYMPTFSSGMQQTLKEIEGISTLAEVVTSCIQSTNWLLDASINCPLNDLLLLLRHDVKTNRVSKNFKLDKADTKVVPSSTGTGTIIPGVAQGKNLEAAAKVVPFSMGAGANHPRVVQGNNVKVLTKAVPSSKGTGKIIPVVAQGNNREATAKIVLSSMGADANNPRFAQSNKVKGTTKVRPSSMGLVANSPRVVQSKKVGAIAKVVSRVVKGPKLKPTAKVVSPPIGEDTNPPRVAHNNTCETTAKVVPASICAAANIPRVVQSTNVKATAKVISSSKGKAHLRKDSILLRKDSFIRIKGSLAKDTWELTDIASTSSTNVACTIISGRSDVKSTFVSVIDMTTGKRIYHKESTSEVANPNCFCSALSSKQIVTVCDPDRMCIFDITTDDVVPKVISSTIPCDHGESLFKFTCLTVDRKRKRIIVGINSKDLYEFDYDMNFLGTIDMLVNNKHLVDVAAVEDGGIVACDWFGLKAFSVSSVNGEIVSEFQKPTDIFTNWRPKKVCTDSYGYIYILWMRDAAKSIYKVVTKYSKDGTLTDEWRVKDNTLFIATTKTADVVRLLAAPKFTGEIFVHDTNFCNVTVPRTKLSFGLIKKKIIGLNQTFSMGLIGEMRTFSHSFSLTESH